MKGGGGWQVDQGTAQARTRERRKGGRILEEF